MGPYYYLYVICPAPTDCFFIGTSLQGCAFTMSITIYKSKCDLPLNTIVCIVGRPVSQKSVSTAVSFDSAQTLQTRQANPSHKPSIDFFLCCLFVRKCIFGVFVLAVSAEANSVRWVSSCWFVWK